MHQINTMDQHNKVTRLLHTQSTNGLIVNWLILKLLHMLKEYFNILGNMLSFVNLDHKY